MPLRTDIDAYVLGETADEDGAYMYLLDSAGRRFVAAARYAASRGYFELVNLVSDGYGPTLFLLLMQKAKRDGLKGVSPDLEYNTDEAKRMNARFYTDPPLGVLHLRNPDARQAEVYLNQIYFLTSELIAEKSARRNADRHFGRTASSRLRLRLLRQRNPIVHDQWHTEDGIRAMLREFLVKSELPFKKSA